MSPSRLIELLIVLFAGAASATAAQAQTPVAKVNGVNIPQARLELLAKSQLTQGQPDTPELRNRIREFLITREVIAQEAVKRGLDKTPEAVTQFELNRQDLLVNMFVQDYARRNPISEDALKKEYDRIKAQMGDKEYKARHILVKSEDDAKQIIAQIKRGGSFEKLAAEKSDDNSKTTGGDLGWNGPERYVQPFADALKKLKKGQMTDAPVNTQFGWHVIRLDDERARPFPPIEEAKPQLQQQLQQQAINKAIVDLRAKARIE